MTSRRDFLRSSLILGGGLVLGDAALEAFERLTHTRKSFPSAAVPWTMRYARVEYEISRHFATLEASDDGHTWRVLQRRPVAVDGSVRFSSDLKNWLVVA